MGLANNPLPMTHVRSSSCQIHPVRSKPMRACASWLAPSTAAARTRPQPATSDQLPTTSNQLLLLQVHAQQQPLRRTTRPHRPVTHVAEQDNDSPTASLESRQASPDTLSQPPMLPRLPTKASWEVQQQSQDPPGRPGTPGGNGGIGGSGQPQAVTRTQSASALPIDPLLQVQLLGPSPRLPPPQTPQTPLLHALAAGVRWDTDGGV